MVMTKSSPAVSTTVPNTSRPKVIRSLAAALSSGSRTLRMDQRSDDGGCSLKSSVVEASDSGKVGKLAER